jgi:hypothetical protein
LTQISSSFTAFNKWVFPVLWLGFLVFFVADSFSNGTVPQEPMALLAPVFMAGIGFVVFRFLVWDLADSVYDHGTFLVVKRGSVEARVPLENIMNVNASMFTSPERVTLRLVKPCALGSSITFSPKSHFSLNPFSKSQIGEQLMERAYTARSKNAL